MRVYVCMYVYGGAMPGADLGLHRVRSSSCVSATCHVCVCVYTYIGVMCVCLPQKAEIQSSPLCMHVLSCMYVSVGHVRV